MFRQYRLFHRILRLYKNNRQGPANNRLFKKNSKLNLFIGAQIFCMPMMTEEVENLKLEDDITKALQEVSEEYRNCLLKQIEIMQKAADIGPFSETWDQLPQYRTLANELHKELSEYYTLFKTLDALARNRYTFGNSGDCIINKFKEIQNFIQKEVDENRRLEKELLKAVTNSIVNEILQEEPNDE